jgi:hypothetical protein
MIQEYLKGLHSIRQTCVGPLIIEVERTKLMLTPLLDATGFQRDAGHSTQPSTRNSFTRLTGARDIVCYEVVALQRRPRANRQAQSLRDKTRTGCLCTPLFANIYDGDGLYKTMSRSACVAVLCARAW